MGEPSPATPSPVRASEDRLDSWKEIAAYLNRDVTTVQRWEKREGMPVHRHLHDRMGSVYASRAELDAWARSRNLPAALENGNSAVLSSPPAPAPISTAQKALIWWKFVLPLAEQRCSLARSSGFRARITSGEALSRKRDFKGSRTSMGWRELLQSHATVSSWHFCPTGMGRWTSGLPRSVSDSSRT